MTGNALKYTMEGFIKVNLAYSRSNSEAVFTVTDSGVGIPASDINLVGERFHRVESVSRSHEGTGIGLSLVKELIKLHGGSMELDSRTASETVDGSHGSTFRVRIPLGSDHLAKDAIDDSAVQASQNSYGRGIVDEAMQWSRDRESSSADSISTDSNGDSTATSSSSRGLDPSTLYFRKEDVIMLVDDSFDTRRYMRSIFAPYCTIVEARDGQEALELCEKSPPNLIISDVMMPRVRGHATSRKVWLTRSSTGTDSSLRSELRPNWR
jgi:PleD family two-component response regulator